MATSKEPIVIWLTGLSGAGKSTIGKRVYQQIKKDEPDWIILDGDSFRELLGNDLGHHHEDRVKNAYRISKMCAYMANHSINVVCCTMSLYPEIWEWNSKNIPGYKLVYLRVPQDELIRRDPKGLYARASRNEESNIIGLDLPFNEPPNPDLVMENSSSSEEAIEQQVQKLLDFIRELKR